MNIRVNLCSTLACLGASCQLTACWEEVQGPSTTAKTLEGKTEMGECASIAGHKQCFDALAPILSPKWKCGAPFALSLQCVPTTSEVLRKSEIKKEEAEPTSVQCFVFCFSFRFTYSSILFTKCVVCTLAFRQRGNIWLNLCTCRFYVITNLPCFIHLKYLSCT